MRWVLLGMVFMGCEKRVMTREAALWQVERCVDLGNEPTVILHIFPAAYYVVACD